MQGQWHLNWDQQSGVLSCDWFIWRVIGVKTNNANFFKDDFRIATLVAWLIAAVVSFDIFCENLLLSARSMAYKCFSLPLLSNCNSCYVVNCQLSFSSHFLRKPTSFCTVLGLRHKQYAGYFPNIRMTLHARLYPKLNIKTLMINILFKALFLIHQRNWRKTTASDKKYQHRITIEIHVLGKFSAKNRPESLHYYLWP